MEKIHGNGGGTKTKFSLCDEHGTIKYEYTSPTCHYLHCGLPGLTDLFAEAVAEICKEADISPKDITRAFVGCAGYGDVQADEHTIGQAAQKGMKDIPFDIGNDCKNALSGALAGKCGINIIAGTGSMGCGRNVADTGWAGIFCTNSQGKAMDAMRKPLYTTF